jgi:hypothetical protein
MYNFGSTRTAHESCMPENLLPRQSVSFTLHTYERQTLYMDSTVTYCQMTHHEYSWSKGLPPGMSMYVHNREFNGISMHAKDDNSHIYVY